MPTVKSAPATRPLPGSDIMMSWATGLQDRLGSDPPLEVWAPTPGPQTMCYESEAFETFYGGQAGGGKTDLLLGLAVTRHQKSIIFRRQFTQLRELVERSKQIVGGLGSFNESLFVWRNLPQGKRLEFGALQYEEDVNKYRGRDHDLKGFDEITEFSRNQYLTIIGWARSVKKGQRVRVVATGNPPSTLEGEWVIERWAPWVDPQYPTKDKPLPGDLLWFARIDGKDVEVESPKRFFHRKEEIIPLSRTFIPAALGDNPYLSQSQYRAVLQSMEEPLRSQLLYGDFSSSRQSDAWQVIPTEWVVAAQNRWMETTRPDYPPRGVGVDVARGGADETVVVQCWGDYFGEPQVFQGKLTPDGDSVADLVMPFKGTGRPYINVDVLGWGASAYDSLKKRSTRVFGINGAHRSEALDKSKQFKLANIRTQMWWALREALDPMSGRQVCIPPGSQILQDLTAPKWEVTPGGVIQVELKTEILKRIKRSPNIGDAFVLAFTLPVTQTSLGSLLLGKVRNPSILIPDSGRGNSWKNPY